MKKSLVISFLVLLTLSCQENERVSPELSLNEKIVQELMKGGYSTQIVSQDELIIGGFASRLEGLAVINKAFESIGHPARFNVDNSEFASNGRIATCSVSSPYDSGDHFCVNQVCWGSPCLRTDTIVGGECISFVTYCFKRIQ